MSLWSRPAVEKRASLDQVFGALISQSTSHARIDGGAIESAQQSVAIRSAVDLIASICSELPIDFFNGKRNHKRMPGWLDDPSGDGYGLQDWIYQLVYSWLYRGNGYGETLDRDPRGWLLQVQLFHPEQVTGQIVDGVVQWSVAGRVIPHDRLKHWRVNPVPGQILGLSPISAHATTIGISLAATRFGKGWFDADAQPTGILRNSLGGIDQDKAKTVKDRFMAAMRGTREPIVMGRGWEWQPLSVNPEESQFLGTMGYSEAQCARILGPGIAEILGYETGDTLTYANVQDRDIQLLKYSVNRWLRRLERVLGVFLPPGWWAEFNRDGLLQTNTVQRYAAYASALAGQPWKEINEVREIENLPPIVTEPPEGEPA